MKYKYVENERQYQHYDLEGGNSYLIPKLNVLPDYMLENYDIHMLKCIRRDSAENSIYHVYFDDTRVGWIFPIQALLSDAHDYANDTHFLKYAHVAYCALIDRLNAEIIEEKQTYGELYLEDYYDTCVHMLVLDNENVSKIREYKFQNYIVGLFVKGYIDNDISVTGELIVDRDPIIKRLAVKSLSKDLVEYEYINSLVGVMLPGANCGYPRFHILYQIIELLMERVFQIEFVRLLENYQYEDRNGIFDLKENISQISGERHRIKLIFQEYSKLYTDANRDLIEQCRALISAFETCEEEDLGVVLYRTRCLLVHRYYLFFDKEWEGRIESINDNFIQLVYEVLTSFDCELSNAKNK